MLTKRQQQFMTYLNEKLKEEQEPIPDWKLGLDHHGSVFWHRGTAGIYATPFFEDRPGVPVEVYSALTREIIELGDVELDLSLSDEEVFSQYVSAIGEVIEDMVAGGHA
jgi:hypothetical protein